MQSQIKENHACVLSLTEEQRQHGFSRVELEESSNLSPLPSECVFSFPSRISLFAWETVDQQSDVLRVSPGPSIVWPQMYNPMWLPIPSQTSTCMGLQRTFLTCPTYLSFPRGKMTVVSFITWPNNCCQLKGRHGVWLHCHIHIQWHTGCETPTARSEGQRTRSPSISTGTHCNLTTKGWWAWMCSPPRFYQQHPTVSTTKC